MTLIEIETALASDILYNVDFVELKTRLNRLIETDHEAAQKVYLAVRRGHHENDNLIDAYYGSPAAHTLKAFAKKLPASTEADTQRALDMWRAIPATYGRAAELLAAAKGRVIKARKPSGKVSATPARTLENTGTCSCCGMNVKLKGGRIVSHGYTLRWGFQSGVCFGTGYLPIEVSPEGLDAGIAGTERMIGEMLLNLEYGCLTASERRVQVRHLSNAKDGLSNWTRARREWAPRPLPKA